MTTVLFDLDGTIANTNEIILRTLAETLEYETGRPWRREELLPNWGMRLRDQLLLLHPEMNLERAVPFYRRRYAEYHESLLAEFPGMRALLEELRAAGYRLGVVTSKKRESADLTLQGLGYDEFFEIVVAEEDTTRHKPAPDPLLYAIAQMGVTADETVYVGDNPDDIRAAQAAKMRAIGVGWTLRPCEELLSLRPDIVIFHPQGLRTWLYGMASAKLKQLLVLKRNV